MPQLIQCFPAGGDYALKFNFDKDLVNALKSAVPEGERAWHKSKYVWLISPEYIETAISALTAFPQVGAVPIPKFSKVIRPTIEKDFLLEYLGRVKDRGGKFGQSAYGSVNGEWSAEFPEKVLKKYFEGLEEEDSPLRVSQQTAYQVLCVVERASVEEIKTAYKRLARQWHPDVCKEPDAHERFIKIDEARKILLNPELRKRYDAGLYFERQEKYANQSVNIFHPLTEGYRSPLRCGRLKTKGIIRLMRFVVNEIINWEDVINSEGKVMTSSWSTHTKKFEISWI